MSHFVRRTSPTGRRSPACGTSSCEPRRVGGGPRANRSLCPLRAPWSSGGPRVSTCRDTGERTSAANFETVVARSAATYGAFQKWRKTSLRTLPPTAREVFPPPASSSVKSSRTWQWLAGNRNDWRTWRRPWLARPPSPRAATTFEGFVMRWRSAAEFPSPAARIVVPPVLRSSAKRLRARRSVVRCLGQARLEGEGRASGGPRRIAPRPENLVQRKVDLGASRLVRRNPDNASTTVGALHLRGPKVVSPSKLQSYNSRL